MSESKLSNLENKVSRAPSKAPIEMSSDDHLRIGSTECRRNPLYLASKAKDIPYALLLSEKELSDYMMKEIEGLRRAHADFLQNPDGRGVKKGFEMCRDDFTFPNLEYRARIGKLPSAIDIKELKKEFFN